MEEQFQPKQHIFVHYKHKQIKNQPSNTHALNESGLGFIARNLALISFKDNMHFQ